jgi:uncharacterized RDD family membrane protein YckC
VTVDDAPSDDALRTVVATAGVALAAARLLARAPGMSPLLERGRAEVDNVLTGRELSRLAAELEPEAERWIQQFVESDQFERALERALSSPRVREALSHQTTTFAGEIVGDLRRRVYQLDERFARLPSRATAFAIDLVLAQVVFLVVSALVGLVGSLAGGLRPAWLFGALAGAGWTLLVGAYFVFFWTLRGQTPGMRLLGLRVVSRSGTTIGVGRAVLRFAALLLAIIPMFAGFLPVFFDEQRRALQDFVARTVVVYSV